MKKVITVFTVSLILALSHLALVQEVVSGDSDFDWEVEIEKIPQGVRPAARSQDNPNLNENQRIELPSLPAAIDEAAVYYYDYIFFKDKPVRCLSQNFEFFQVNNNVSKYYIPSNLRCSGREPPLPSGDKCWSSWGIYGKDTACFSHQQGLDAARNGRDWDSPLHPKEYNW